MLLTSRIWTILDVDSVGAGFLPPARVDRRERRASGGVGVECRAAGIATTEWSDEILGTAGFDATVV